MATVGGAGGPGAGGNEVELVNMLHVEMEEMEEMVEAATKQKEEVDLITRARELLFEALFELCDDLNVVSYSLYLFWFIHTVQLLFFALAPQPALSWHHEPLMRDNIHVVLLALSFIPRQAVLHGASVFAYPALNLFAVSFAYTLLVLILFAWSILAASGWMTYNPRWRTTLLRSLTRCGMHGFALPLFTSLLSPLSCVTDEMWLNSSQECFTGVHTFFIVVACILTPLLFVYFFVMSLVMVDRKVDVMRKKNLLSAAHGRVEAAQITLFMVQAIVWTFMGVRGNVPGWLFLAVQLVCAFASAAMYLHLLPYFHMILNSLQTGMNFLVVGTCVAAFVSLGVDKVDNDTGSIIFLLMLPSTFYIGYVSAIIRWDWVVHATNSASAMMVELRARAILQEALRNNTRSSDELALAITTGTEEGSRTPRNGAPEEQSYMERLGAAIGGVEEVGTGVTGPGGGQPLKAPPGLSYMRTAMGLVMAITPTLEARASRQKSTLLPYYHSAFLRMLDVYRQGLQHFAASALLEVFMANFHNVIRANRHLERVHLRAAMTKAESSVALDVRFYVWQQHRRAAMEDEAQSHQKMTVQKRMEFEQLQLECAARCTGIRTLMNDFWTVLQDRAPDLDRLVHVGSNIYEQLRVTQEAYEKLLEMAPTRPAIVRDAAQFFAELANDQRRAADLYSDAEQLEDEQSRMHANATEGDVLLGAMVDDFDLSGDSTGIVRVSSLSQNIGIMTAANAAALRLLGVSKREALGKDVNIIVPEPIAAIHPAMLVQYNSNGEDVIVNTSRIYFIKHRGGYVFPAKVNVCPQESEWVAAVEELQTSLSFVWFVGSPDNWQLVGSCKKAMTALNLEPNMMASGTIPVDRIIPNVDDVVARLQGRESGDFVRLNCLDTTDIAMSSSSVLGTDGHRNKKNGNGKRAGASAAPAHLVVHGKLQVIVLAMLDVPLYILRYRIASETEARVFDSTVALSGRSAPLSARPTTSSRVLSSRSFGGGAAGMKMPGGGHGAGGDISLCPVMRSIKPAAAASASGAGSHARVHAAENPHAVSASGNPSRGGSSEVSESESESDGDERTHMLQRGRQGRTGRATIAVGATGKRGSASSSGAGAGARASASRSAVAAVGARSATSQKRASAALPSPSPRSDSEEEEDMGSGEATGSEQEEGSDAGDSADAANGSEDEDVLASEVKRAPPRPALATTPGSRHAGTNGDVQGPLSPLRLSKAGGLGNASPAESAGGGAGTMTPSVIPGHIKDASTPGKLALLSPGSVHSRSVFGQSQHAVHTSEEDSGEGEAGGSTDALGGEGSGMFTGLAPTPTVDAKPAGLSVATSDAGGGGGGGSSTAAGALSPSRVSFLGAGGGGATGRSDSSAPKRRGSGLGFGHGGGDAYPGATNPLAKQVSAAGGSAVGGGRAGSVHSKGSASSAGTNFADALRRSVITQNSGLERSLRPLRIVVVVLVFAVAAMNITAMVITSEFMSDFVANMEHVVLTGKGTMYLTSSFSALYDMVLYNEGKIDLPRGVNGTMTWSSRQADLFEDVHQQLYLSIKPSNVAQRMLYTNNTLVVRDLVPGSYVNRTRFAYTTRTINLANAGLEYLAKARLVYAMPTAAIVMHEPTVFWIMENCAHGLFPAFNASIEAALSQSEHQMSVISVAGTAILIVAMSLFGSIVPLIMLPAVYRVFKSKEGVFTIFLNVPVPIVRGLQVQSMKRLLRSRRLQANDEDDERGDMLEDTDMPHFTMDDDDHHAGQITVRGGGGDAVHVRMTSGAAGAGTAYAAHGGAHGMGGRMRSVDGGDYDESDDNFVLRSALNAYSNRTIVDPNAQDEEVSRGSAGCCAGLCRKKKTAALMGRRSHQREYRNVRSSHQSLLALVMWPILLCIVYYIAVFLWKSATSVDFKRGEVQTKQAVAIQLFIPHIAFDVQQAWGYCEPSWSARYMKHVGEVSDWTIYVQDALLYGSEALNTDATAQEQPDTFALFMRNGCVENNNDYYPVSTCRDTFMDGMLSRSGLRAAMSEYTQRCKQAVADRAIAYAEGNCSLAWMKSSAAVTLQEFSNFYLLPGLEIASSIQLTHARTTVTGFVQANTTVATLSVVGLFAVFLFFYRPLIVRLDREIKQSRSLLLLFPDEVVRAVPSIKMEGRRLITDSGSGRTAQR